MCGIAGYKRMGDEPITDAHIKIMLHYLTKRGPDASGCAIQYADGSIFTQKAAMTGWEFASDKRFDKFLKEHLPNAQTVILHARAATQGSPRDNRNNHPCDNGITAIVHNGHIWNDDQLFKEKDLALGERVGEVDSDVIRAILDKDGLTERGLHSLGRMRGTAAIAAMSTAYPGKLLLARSGNPIVFASTPELLAFASEKEFLHSALRPVFKRWNMPFQPNIPGVGFSTMPDETAYLIGPDGLEHHERFYLNAKYFAPTYNRHDTFRRHMDRWTPEKLPDHVVCRNPSCGKTVRIKNSQREKELHKLVCNKCNWQLAPNPEDEEIVSS